MISRFLRWLTGRAPARSDLRIVLYTRAGCHLCDEAWQLLEKSQRKWGFLLEAVDIDADPTMIAEHGNWVPVVAINGVVRFRGRVNPVLLQRLLDARPANETANPDPE